MNSNEPLGAPAPFPVISGTVEPVNRSQGDYSLRDGRTLVSEAIDMYMAAYAGRDLSRLTRLGWWLQEIGHLALRDVDQDHVFHALEALAKRKPRYWAGKDADGNPILKAKTKVVYPQDQELRRVDEPLQNPHQIECEMDILSEFRRGSKTG